MSEDPMVLLHRRGEFCGPGGRHMLVTIYHRPWWNWFRKTNEIRCWECDVVVRDPEYQASQ